MGPSLHFHMNRVRDSRFFGKVENAIAMWGFRLQIKEFLQLTADGRETLNKLLELVLPQLQHNYNKLEAAVISVCMDALFSTFFAAKTKNVGNNQHTTNVLDYTKYYTAVSERLTVWKQTPDLLLKGDSTLWNVLGKKYNVDPIVQMIHHHPFTEEERAAMHTMIVNMCTKGIECWQRFTESHLDIQKYTAPSADTLQATTSCPDTNDVMESAFALAKFLAWKSPALS